MRQSYNGNGLRYVITSARGLCTKGLTLGWGLCHTGLELNAKGL